MNFKEFTDDHLKDLLRSKGAGKAHAALQEQAFGEIYQRYWLTLFQVAWQKTGNREAAEELVQDLFVRLWERRPELDINSSLKNYLLAAIRYRVINFIRGEVLSSKHLTVIKSNPEPEGNGTEDDLYFRELGSNLQASIERLPGKSRTIFELSRSKHFSNKQIAGQLKISEKTVEYHLSKSLKLLRVYLKDFVTVLLILLIRL